MKNNLTITRAKTKNHFSEAKVLFLEYAKELNLDLYFQDFDKELGEISIQYNTPSGVLLLMKYKNKCIGCVGLRKTGNRVAEMKRMYVKKGFRGKGAGKKLVNKVLQYAKKLKYRFVRLDTLPQMKEAINLYLSFGFREIKPYRFNPVDGTKYMEIQLPI